MSVGFTGAPGVGKSSLDLGARRRTCAPQGHTVGVISVDPSSPFTHGALLGDRIRLTDHFLDPGVFIRSMGTRGHAGGLAEATLQALLLLDASGKDVVFLETVGAGQSEVGVLSIADTVVLVLMPGSGDSIQALKAGIMEIPDVIAINKRDHPLAATTRERRAAGARARPAGAAAADRAHRGAPRRGRRRALGSDRRRTARGSRPTGSSRSAARATSRPRCSRSPRRARAGIWRMQCQATPSCGGCSTRCGAASSIR